jgi:phospholipid/cholesterol/gamma-HCH transport system substrate-binding protein
VGKVAFADNDTGVIVTAEIDQGRHLYSNEQCKAVSPLLMGDASLEFVTIANFQGEKVEIKPGAVLQGSVAADMTGSIAGLQRQAAQTLATLDTAGRDMHTVLTRVDRLVERNEERITRMIAEADETMQLLQKALAASNDILGDPKLREQIKQTISEMPAVLKETRGAVEQIGGTFASLERNMQNIEGLTKPLGERGPMLVDEFDASLKKLNLLSDNMLRFSQELNDPQGSLGALLHDRELYQHVNHVAKNMDELIRDLKPILNDARVFTDKIARHPELLGVRGAIKKDAGLKDSLSNNGPETDVPETRRWPIGGSGQWSIGR